ncbi:MAG: mannitol dehydrogenase [Clostridia bacterium]|nr:mannitol dehydrogenase [Clostridia bacterium]
MKAIMYGGGNIGRGFIGMLLSKSGYEVTFIDVMDTVVDTLNREHTYPVRIIKGDTYEDIDVENVSAINGKDVNAVAEAIANADIMATAVGVNVLKFIVPNIVEGLRLRKERNLPPFNIVICENLMDANKVLEGMIKEKLSDDEQKWFDENVGLVEASIGRMVPVQTEDMKDGNPMRICVESYNYLPVDKDAFKGEIPQIDNMIPFSPFDFYIKRKLYIHNMGHAICAYLGDLYKLEYIYESIDKDDVYIIVRGAMEESARALSKKYNVMLEDIILHITDLLDRFTNAALRDTCKRVGGDPARKLSPKDRLIGASKLAIEMGITPVYISIGVAAALFRYLSEAQDKTLTPELILEEVCCLKTDEELSKLVVNMFALMKNGTSLKDIRRYADKIVASKLINVI